jgi:hypothetical protein
MSSACKQSTNNLTDHLSKCAITDVTDVGLFSRVPASVTLEDVLLCEGHRTQVTLERSLLAVDPAVFLEVSLLKEPLPALLTFLVTNLWINKYTLLQRFRFMMKIFSKYFVS